uniref:Uncharacterized protein n=1 Tax=Timema monikensis TaxID=170555 RepID=A0A7R9HM19_9NEOP|nr:unnamed protein product [Timema monikensis]
MTGRSRRGIDPPTPSGSAPADPEERGYYGNVNTGVLAYRGQIGETLGVATNFQCMGLLPGSRDVLPPVLVTRMITLLAWRSNISKSVLWSTSVPPKRQIVNIRATELAVLSLPVNNAIQDSPLPLVNSVTRESKDIGEEVQEKEREELKFEQGVIITVIPYQRQRIVLFQAYAAGCNIVILASTFERVQIIPGAWHNYIRISCLDCSTDTGKIAAAYENQVCIYEPTPLILNNSSHSHTGSTVGRCECLLCWQQLDYRWVQTGTLQIESHITSLSWNLEGTRLLTGGQELQLWHQHVGLVEELETGELSSRSRDRGTISIRRQGNYLYQEPGTGELTLSGDSDRGTIYQETGELSLSGASDRGTISVSESEDAHLLRTLLEEDRGWECIWKCHTATPVVHMAFSPDGTLFATSGKSDRLVKIWFENKQLLFPSKSVDHPMSYGGQSTFNEINYGFVYVAHPRAVTNLSWRKTSKYMPKGAVSNMLVTSCRDNICRVWVETVLPDDGLVNMSQFDPLASQNPKFRTHRHKHRFMQRLKHMKTCFHIRRHAKNTQVSGAIGGLMGIPLGSPIPTLPSTYSVHDFHSYGYHGTGVTPGLHFHLAASINAETGARSTPRNSYLVLKYSVSPASMFKWSKASLLFLGRFAEDGENGVQILVGFNEDIPLVPSLLTGDPEKEPNFILHWLNNKEMHFSQQAENILHELTKKVVEKEEGLEGQHNAYLHESEHDDHSPRKQQRSGKLGKTLSTDESSEEHHPSFPSSCPHSHQSLSVTVRPCGNHSCCHLLLPYLSRSPLRYFLYVVHLLSSSSVGTNLRQTANLDTKISSSSATTSINSLATDSGPVHIPDSLDAKIEGLLRDWHHNPDLLFSIHPIDGSYLICRNDGLFLGSFGATRVVEFLDEYHPGSFRQAQVSFSTRIPNAFPLGDAMTMSTNVCLYNAYGCHLNYRDVLKPPSASKGPVSATAGGNNEENGEPLPSVLEEDTEAAVTDNQEDESNDTKTSNQNGSGSSVGVDSGTGGNLSDIVSGDPSPAISMVSKHSNGTLNLWQLTFGDHSKFSQVLSIGHSSRASGHRFRVNDITCHPVLPLLLTTSHHNITDVPGTPVTINPHNKDDNYSTFTGFCSELILWRVDAVGPLSKSGGVSELARINSPEISAFSNVAWIPTLLPRFDLPGDQFINAWFL